MSWQLTNVKRTGRASPSRGAVNVRPTRLPLPSASVKRYQYSVAGVSPAAMKRQVQSVSAVTSGFPRATTIVVECGDPSRPRRKVGRRRAVARARLAARPEQDAVGRGVAGGDALRVQVAALAPRGRWPRAVRRRRARHRRRPRPGRTFGGSAWAHDAPIAVPRAAAHRTAGELKMELGVTASGWPYASPRRSPLTRGTQDHGTSKVAPHAA